jgi:hypothetical protein
VSVSKDGRSLEIKRPSDKGAVKVPVLDHCRAPAGESRRVHGLRLEGEAIIVTYGKGCWADVASRSLTVECGDCE